MPTENRKELKDSTNNSNNMQNEDLDFLNFMRPGTRTGMTMYGMRAPGRPLSGWGEQALAKANNSATFNQRTSILKDAKDILWYERAERILNEVVYTKSVLADLEYIA